MKYIAGACAIAAALSAVGPAIAQTQNSTNESSTAKPAAPMDDQGSAKADRNTATQNSTNESSGGKFTSGPGEKTWKPGTTKKAPTQTDD